MTSLTVVFTFNAAVLNSFSFVWLQISQLMNPCETPCRHTHTLYFSVFSPTATTIPSDQFWFHSVPNDDTLIASTMPLPHSTLLASSFLACSARSLAFTRFFSPHTAHRCDLAVSCFLLTVLRHKICGCLGHLLMLGSSRCPCVSHVRSRSPVHQFLGYTFILMFLRFWLLISPTQCSAALATLLNML